MSTTDRPQSSPWLALVAVIALAAGLVWLTHHRGVARAEAARAALQQENEAMRAELSRLRAAAAPVVPPAPPETPTPAPEQASAEPAPVADSPVPAAPSAPPEPEDRADAGRDREFAERVLAHVRQRLAQPLSPVELADAFHVSLRTLQRRLKAGLDTSPQDLVLAARLEAARELLREGRWRVGEVAARVGFDDLSHFSRRYRQAYGHPPSAETASPRDL